MDNVLTLAWEETDNKQGLSLYNKLHTKYYEETEIRVHEKGRRDANSQRLVQKLACEQRAEVGEGESQGDIWPRHVTGGGSSRCRGPEVGVSWAGVRARGEEGKSPHSAGVIKDGHGGPGATLAGRDEVGQRRASLSSEPACLGPGWLMGHGWGQREGPGKYQAQECRCGTGTEGLSKGQQAWPGSHLPRRSPAVPPGKPHGRCRNPNSHSNSIPPMWRVPKPHKLCDLEVPVLPQLPCAYLREGRGPLEGWLQDRREKTAPTTADSACASRLL